MVSDWSVPAASAWSRKLLLGSVPSWRRRYRPQTPLFRYGTATDFISSVLELTPPSFARRMTPPIIPQSAPAYSSELSKFPFRSFFGGGLIYHWCAEVEDLRLPPFSFPRNPQLHLDDCPFCFDNYLSTITKLFINLTRQLFWLFLFFSFLQQHNPKGEGGLRWCCCTGITDDPSRGK